MGDDDGEGAPPMTAPSAGPDSGYRGGDDPGASSSSDAAPPPPPCPDLSSPTLTTIHNVQSSGNISAMATLADGASCTLPQSAQNTPLLGGEAIFLSFSNETTPVGPPPATTAHGGTEAGGVGGACEALAAMGFDVDNDGAAAAAVGAAVGRGEMTPFADSLRSYSQNSGGYSGGYLSSAPVSNETAAGGGRGGAAGEADRRAAGAGEPPGGDGDVLGRTDAAAERYEVDSPPLAGIIVEGVTPDRGLGWGGEADTQIDMTLSPSSLVFLDAPDLDDGPAPGLPDAAAWAAPHSPPPSSVLSGALTNTSRLSPPPISMRSGLSNDRRDRSDSLDYRSEAGHASESGNRSMFSAEHRYPIPSPAHSSAQVQNAGQTQQPSSLGGGKKRPPLPPRFALGGTAANGGGNHPGPGGVAQTYSGGMALPPSGSSALDEAAPHPPRQIVAPSGHRRVLSTGDASYLSNLTEPESEGEDGGKEPSPPGGGGGGGGVGGGVVPPMLSGMRSQTSETRRRGPSWDDQAQGYGSDGSHNCGGRYGNEERAAFGALGILQPVLDGPGDLGGGGSDGSLCLMQPILLDDGEDDADAAPVPGGAPGVRALERGPDAPCPDETDGKDAGPSPVLGGGDEPPAAPDGSPP